MVGPLILGLTIEQILASLAVGSLTNIGTDVISAKFDKTSQEICACLAVLDESVKQVRDAVLGLDVGRESLERLLAPINAKIDELSSQRDVRLGQADAADKNAGGRLGLGGFSSRSQANLLQAEIDELQAVAAKIGASLGTDLEDGIAYCPSVTLATTRGPTTSPHLPRIKFRR